MFLFEKLFGRREKAASAEAAPEAPAAEPNVPQGEHVAPGTTIHYNADLIGRLTGDHQLLLQLFGDTKAAADNGDVAQAAARLEEFRIVLQGHLLTENIRLYVYLEHSHAGDPSSHALIHEFRHEMDGIGKAVVGFLAKYRELAIRPDLAADFSAELAGVGAVLVERIRREEETLYPLYTG